MLKVIHVSQRDDSATGGALRVAYELVRRLPACGIDARMLYLYGAEGSFGAALPERSDHLRIPNSRHVHQFVRLLRYLWQVQPDIVHFHDDLLWPQLLNAGPRPWKTVIHAHGGGTAAPQPLKTRALYSIQRKHADLVICITDEARRSQADNVGFRPEKLQVIYNGVDLQTFSLGKPNDRERARARFCLSSDAVVIGFVGRLHDAMKGCLDFVDLISRLPKRFVGLVVGSGPDEFALRNRGQDLAVANRLVFAGQVEDTTTAYHAMDVFCFLSRHEPFGLTIAEAMACGVPVVGFSCPGGSGELLTGETGCVIDNRNLESMVSEVQSAAQRRRPWSDRLTAARSSLSQKHDWEVSARRLADMYLDLVNMDNK